MALNDEATIVRDGPVGYLKTSFDRHTVFVPDVAGITKFDTASSSFTPYTRLTGLGGGISVAAIDGAGRAVAFKNHNGVAVIDGSGNVSKPIPSCCTGYLMEMDATGNRAYLFAGGIEVFDFSLQKKIGLIGIGDTISHAGDGPGVVGNMTISRDGKLIGVITDNGISIVRTDAVRAPPPAELASIKPCPATITAPLVIDVEGEISGITIDDACEFVYASNLRKNRVEVFSLSAGRLLAPIPVGAAPAGIDTSPDGKFLYTANTAANNLSVVDLQLGREIRKVPINTTSVNEKPFSLAVAQNGLVLFSTTFGGYGGTQPQQYDPISDSVSFRGTPSALSEHTRLAASGDRSVIALVASDASDGPIQRYVAATDTLFQQKAVDDYAGYIALSRDGMAGMVTNGYRYRTTGTAGAYVLNADFSVAGRITFSEPTTLIATFGVAVSPDGKLGYEIVSPSINIYDLATRKLIDHLPLPEGIGRSPPPDDGLGAATSGGLTISRDGSLLAMPAGSGFILVRPKGYSLTPQPNLMIVASTANPNLESYLRLTHTRVLEKQKFTVTLADLESGRPYVRWSSPEHYLPEAWQYSVGSIEASATTPFAKPEWYLATIDLATPGTYSHVIWQKDVGALTNFTACDTTVIPTRANTVYASGPGVIDYFHSSLIGNMYRSNLALINIRDQAVPLNIVPADGSRKFFFGRYRFGLIPGNSGALLTARDIETHLEGGSDPLTDTYQYSARLEAEGPVLTPQHLLYNAQPGFFADMTAACPVR